MYLVDDAKAHQPATAEQREHYVQSREAAITEQKRSAASSATEHKKAMEAKFADKIAAKRAERAAKRAELNATKPSAAHQTEAEAGLVALAAPEPETAETSTAKATLGQAAKEKEPAEDVSQVAHHIKIRGPSQGLPWYQPDRFTYDTLEEAKQAGLWSYPSTPEETSRCQVFQDLWEKGNYMGNGLRFGGSFLVYPGLSHLGLYRPVALKLTHKHTHTDDPLRYHSHFSTTILQDTTVPLSPTDIVSSGRLATAVKKAHLLCAPVRDARANDEERVQYFSLEWASMG